MSAVSMPKGYPVWLPILVATPFIVASWFFESMDSPMIASTLLLAAPVLAAIGGWPLVAGARDRIKERRASGGCSPGFASARGWLPAVIAAAFLVNAAGLWFVGLPIAERSPEWLSGLGTAAMVLLYGAVAVMFAVVALVMLLVTRPRS